MSINLIQTTSQRQILQQRLVLTQELQLFLKLIQMTTLELKDYLEEQLIENPTLEESQDQTEKNEDSSNEEIDFNNMGNDRLFRDQNNDIPHYSSREFFDDSQEDTTWENRISSAESLIDHLRWQLKLSALTAQEKEIASIIIGNTNEDGYLEMDIEEIAHIYLKQSAHQTNGISENATDEKTCNTEKASQDSDNKYIAQIKDILHKIQSSFDPTGVCSRNLRECLKIQALDLGYPEDGLVLELIDKYLEELNENDLSNIEDIIQDSAQQIQEAMSVISSLEPRPGRPFFAKDSEKYIVPDFYVYKVGNELQIQLNRDFPKVRISNYYKNLIKKEKSLPPDAKKFIKEKLEAAHRIMKCLDEREATVKKIISKIVDVQRDFFEHGKKYIKPLILKDVAQSVGVHESTVSRITSRRYIQTPQGTIELKSLFSRRIESSNGKDVSFEKVKAIMKNIIDGELPLSPYSDEDISKIFERRKIKVARRTIAKYRKILKIPSSSTRSRQYKENSK
ncbi:MAG: RNA polymerase factor sigma-54 [Candidatus Dadabacteria bacterium]|nr:RNA polymerase factor sigma-54 [Candidatus Dadabacteria bacterium]